MKIAAPFRTWPCPSTRFRFWCAIQGASLHSGQTYKRVIGWFDKTKHPAIRFRPRRDGRDSLIGKSIR